MNSESSLNRDYPQNFSQPRAAKVGWGILLGVSVLLMLAGLSWFGMLPQMMLENISEHANLDPGNFMQGNPSAFDIITMIARGYGAGYAALGLMALLISFEGYRHGTRWAWKVMWVLVAVYLAIGGLFFMAGERFALSLPILFIAVVTAVGLLMSRKSLS